MKDDELQILCDLLVDTYRVYRTKSDELIDEIMSRVMYDHGYCWDSLQRNWEELDGVE